jgi:hypothetical protein
MFSYCLPQIYQILNMFFEAYNSGIVRFPIESELQTNMFSLGSFFKHFGDSTQYSWLMSSVTILTSYSSSIVFHMSYGMVLYLLVTPQRLIVMSSRWFLCLIQYISLKHFIKQFIWDGCSIHASTFMNMLCVRNISIHQRTPWRKHIKWMLKRCTEDRQNTSPKIDLFI